MFVLLTVSKNVRVHTTALCGRRTENMTDSTLVIASTVRYIIYGSVVTTHCTRRCAYMDNSRVSEKWTRGARAIAQEVER